MTRLPLEGLRIVELANVVAGPSVGKHLSDFGAEVVKVERPGVGDSTRAMGRRLGSRSAWWVVIGRNKRSLTLDLKDRRGREAFLRLCETADALVESQRPGVLESLDLAPEALRARNEGLIVVRISGFGQTGPYARRPGFGTLAEAFSGLASITGEPEGPPRLAPTAIADEIAGLYATWALMVALYGRDCAQLPGQTIDVSLFEALFTMLGPLPTLYQQDGYEQGRHGSRLPWSAPRNVYRSADGQYFVVSGTAPAPAAAILRLIGGDALVADSRFATAAARDEHADDLDRLVAEWIGARSAADVDAAFAEHQIAGIRVYGMADVFADRHYTERQTLVEVPDDELGPVSMQAPVPRFSATPGRIRHTGAELGTDTAQLLRELGFDDDDIEVGFAEGSW
jgi:crotonobetainyl-CoA:carnitine CoA-transferase CaiB-like acyl-CoA transferase